VTIPDILIQQEIARLQHDMEGQIAQVGGNLNDYLTHIGKKLEDLHAQWRPEAEKRAKMQLILNAIASQENLMPDTETVEREVAHLKEHYPSADEENIRTYVMSVKQNEMVFAMLENAGA